MQLLFKQRMFSWLCSYDVFDAHGQTVYRVEGQLSWGHCLKIFDAHGREIGTVKQQVLTFMPKFELSGILNPGCTSESSEETLRQKKF